MHVRCHPTIMPPIFVLGVLLATALLCGCPDNQHSPLGANLDGVSDWSTDWPFTDAFKTARPWISGEAHVWEDGRPLDLDDQGWVRSLQLGQVARTLLFRQAPRYPAGQYHVFYEGDGVLGYRFAARKIPELSVPGHDVLDVDPARDGGINIEIYQTNPANYLRNIRVIMPGGVMADSAFTWVEDPGQLPQGMAKWLHEVYESQPFHPVFLDRIRRYKTLRFMDWMATNWSPVSAWADHAHPGDATYATARGVPVEVMCLLANTINADPWFTIPHLATDEFVSNFAAVVRDQLRPGLKAHIEYSNEVWNGGFGQGQYCQQRGLALGLSTVPFEAGQRYYAQRSVEIFQIFANVMGGTSRLVRVVSSQAANTGVSPMILGWKDTHAYTDALAIAPYFGYELGLTGNVARVEQMTLDDLFAELETVSLPQAYQWMNAQAAVARQYGVTLLAYEGGQHLVGVNEVRENATLNALFDAANRDPRMGPLYGQYLREWRKHSEGVFCHFSHCGAWSKFGRWGGLEYMTQPISESPKHQAILNFISAVQEEAVRRAAG
jgi:hypothetical protein